MALSLRNEAHENESAERHTEVHPDVWSSDFAKLVPRVNAP